MAFTTPIIPGRTFTVTDARSAAAASERLQKSHLDQYMDTRAAKDIAFLMRSNRNRSF